MADKIAKKRKGNVVIKSILYTVSASALSMGVIATSEAALLSSAILNFDETVYDNNGLVVVGSNFGLD